MSLDARNIEAARNVEPASVSQEVLEEVEEVTPVFPCGFHRLPSAMRPPVRRGHVRSASAGGNFSLISRGQVQRNNSSATAKDTKGIVIFITVMLSQCYTFGNSLRK